MQKPSAVDSAREHFERGHAAYGEGRLKEALLELERADQLSPSAELAYDLGRVCERLGEAERAIGYFSRYLENKSLTDDERSEVRQRIVSLQALASRQRLQLREPPPTSAALDAEARAFFARGLKLFAKGHYQAALAAFEAARRNARVPEIIFDMALTAEKLGRSTDAIDYYREYLRSAPDAADAEQIEARIRALRR